MTIDQKLTDASASIREARRSAEFTVQAPTTSRLVSGGGAALLAVAAVLLLVGLPLAVFSSMSKPTSGAVGSQATASPETASVPGFVVVAYVEADLDAPPQELIAAVTSRPEVAAVAAVDKAMSEAEAREFYADDESFLRILDERPGLLPASLRVRVDTQAQADELTIFLSRQSDVYKVDSYYGTIDVLPPESGIATTEDAPAATTTTVAAAPIDEETAAYVAMADRLGAEPISAEELERITGMGPHAAELGYRITQESLDEPNAELGLIVYRDLLSGDEEGIVYTCFHDYAFINGLSGVGGAHCAPTIEKTEQIAAANIAASRSCSLGDKDSPDYVDDQAWTLVTVWGVPSGVDAVDMALGDGTTESIGVSSEGVAQMVRADLGDIVSISFDGMTERHKAMVSAFPYPAIDCGPDDGSRG